MTFSNTDGSATIKIANSPDYQKQDKKNGIPTSELKMRAEFNTMKLLSTQYGEGDSWVYRVALVNIMTHMMLEKMADPLGGVRRP